VSEPSGFDDRADDVVRAAFGLAEPAGVLEPRQLLVAALQADGPLRQLVGHKGAARPNWRAAAGLDRAPAVTPDAPDVYVDVHARQALDSTTAWAAGLGVHASPEHLVVVLVEQQSEGVLVTVRRAGTVPAIVRRAALDALGLPADQAPVRPAWLPPVGTAGRPRLPASELPAAALDELRRRLDRLPLSRLRRFSDWLEISANEERAAMRVADEHHLDDERRYSLLQHHDAAVQRLAAAAMPPGTAPRPEASPVTAQERPRTLLGGWTRWFGNRRR
jgi:hypothetical protein